MNEEKDVEEVNKQDDMQRDFGSFNRYILPRRARTKRTPKRSSVSNLESAAVLNNQPT